MNHNDAVYTKNIIIAGLNGNNPSNSVSIKKNHVLPHHEVTVAFIMAKFREKHDNDNKKKNDVMVNEGDV